LQSSPSGFMGDALAVVAKAVHAVVRRENLAGKIA
jgi:hypothetical protein